MSYQILHYHLKKLKRAFLIWLTLISLLIYLWLDNLRFRIFFTKNDKKSKSGKINWILLEDIGKPVIRNDVPEEIIIRSLKSIFV